MSTDGENANESFISILSNPSKALANWYFWLGSLGLLLAILNILGIIHPNYRVSWGGLFTFELTNAAFDDKDTAPFIVASDAIFIALCGGLVYLGSKTLSAEDGLGEWLTSMAKSDWYNDLVDMKDGGWSLIIGTWCIMGSIVFYFWWGILHTGWIDPGVYSIAIALMATGLISRKMSTLTPEE